jgi:hypothetical protein
MANTLRNYDRLTIIFRISFARSRKILAITVDGFSTRQYLYSYCFSIGFVSIEDIFGEENTHIKEGGFH